MKNRPTYAGKYSGEGTAFVKAPISKSEGKAPTVKTGTDLRTGKKKGM